MDITTEIVKDGSRWMVVANFAGVENRYTMYVRTKGIAQRLVAAIEAGVALTDFETYTDKYGYEFARYERHVSGLDVEGDLDRLGF